MEKPRGFCVDPYDCKVLQVFHRKFDGYQISVRYSTLLGDIGAVGLVLLANG